MNANITGIEPSISLAVTSKAKTLAAEGKQVINFAAGEPDFDTPDCIKQAAIDALARGETKYTPSSGLLALRKAIAAKLESENGLHYEPGQIIVSCGAKHSLFNVIMALCSPGDEVIFASPYWLSYPEMIRVASAVPVILPTREDQDFKLTPAALEAAITPRARTLILNSPSNPIGNVYSADELRALGEVALAHDLWIISDEIYEKMIYDGLTHASIGSFGEDFLRKTVTVNGFSKAFSMTGWRLGYAAAPPEVARAVDSLQSHSTSNPTTFAQYGALAALAAGDAVIAGMLTAFAERRDLMVDLIAAIDGVTCVRPQGAFYMLPNISAFGLDSATFASRLIDEYQVASVPGAAFGDDHCIRLSYACGPDSIREGVKRLATFIDTLR